MDDITVTTLENKVIELLLAGENPVLNVLRKQFDSLRIDSRQYTGVGYYLNFKKSHKVEGLLEYMQVKNLFCLGDVDVMISNGNNRQRVGFLLWVKDGYLDSLEAYTYGDDKWPNKIDDFQLRYLDNHRDFDNLKQNWEL